MPILYSLHLIVMGNQEFDFVRVLEVLQGLLLAGWSEKRKGLTKREEKGERSHDSTEIQRL